MILTFSNHSCQKNGMRGYFPESSRPKLNSLEIWSVKHKLFISNVIGCCSLQVLYIRTMSQFSLCISSNYFPISSQWKPFFSLLVITKVFNSGNENTKVQSKWPHVQGISHLVDDSESFIFEINVKALTLHEFVIIGISFEIIFEFLLSFQIVVSFEIWMQMLRFLLKLINFFQWVIFNKHQVIEESFKLLSLHVHFFKDTLIIYNIPLF